uniref:Uncharacterized protein n=1 Tax=Cucumis sativus TaxID=3659 RepID=A0A0A0K9L3_CUCSA
MADTCFFFENDGNGRELGDGDIENADPAYTSAFPAIGLRTSTIRICFATVSGAGPNLSVPHTTILSPSFFRASLLIFESRDSPRLKIVTFSITKLFFIAFKSSELDLFETDGSE